MTQDNQQDQGFTNSLGEDENSTKFTFVGRSQTKYLETPAGETGNIKVIEIAAMSVPGAVADLGSDVDNKALAGFDTIFSPYTTASGHAELPHFGNPTNITDPNSLTLNPFNPNNIFSTEKSQAENNTMFQKSGHNIQFANTWTTGDIFGASSTGDVDFAKDLYENGKFSYTGVKSIGLRSPMVLTGWGFDVDGNPVPSDTGRIDDGIAPDPTSFASGAFRDPSLWKSGPLDVRWDDERKVWAAGGGGSMVAFILKETLQKATHSLTGPSVARAILLRQDPKNVGDYSWPSGQHLEGIPKVPDTGGLITDWDYVVNRSRDFSALQGAMGFAMKTNGELLITWVDCTANPWPLPNLTDQGVASGTP